MLLTGEVYRAAKATVVACKQRELQQAIRIQLPATVPAQHLVHFTRRPTARARGKEGVMSRQRKLVSA
jgi:hypothetical protein